MKNLSCRYFIGKDSSFYKQISGVERVVIDLLIGLSPLTFSCKYISSRESHYANTNSTSSIQNILSAGRKELLEALYRWWA